MKEMEVINSLQWHDGMLREVKINCGQRVSLTLSLEIYENESHNSRSGIFIDFSDVDSLNCNMDFVALAENRSAGNISNAYAKRIERTKKFKFFMYLTDGIIGFTFRGAGIHRA